jgi:hypothetical protein
MGYPQKHQADQTKYTLQQGVLNHKWNHSNEEQLQNELPIKQF